ncbi:MAG TPA: enoyl-CoA hydratase/isomerase family protein [Spirochaetota bacterium]|nr:enoyl-CoA hydratase/isomerase family protein [Spirochaetota bacterium]
MESLVTFKVEKGTAFMALNRPEKRNALNGDVLKELDGRLREAEGNDEARSVVLHGEGPCFSAGVDFNFIAGMGGVSSSTARKFRVILSDLQSVLNLMERMEKPVICAIHGVCVGLGMELCLAADFRIMTKDCRLGMPEVDFGLIPDVGGITRLVRLVGMARAKEIIMTAMEVPAEHALAMGLINRIAGEGGHLDEARAMAALFNRKAPLALGMVKKVIDRGGHLDKYSFQELEAFAQSLLLATGDVAEGFAAKMEKREPRFLGR